MNEFWKRASSKNLNQVRRIITSYSKKELDPDDPLSAVIAARISQEHAEKYYPDRQVLICVQSDGEGGCLHVHELVSNVSISDLKGCTDEQTKWEFVVRTTDEIAAKYIIPEITYDDIFDEKGRLIRKAKNIFSQSERHKREENEQAVKKGKKPPHYIWKDDLKERIKSAMSEAIDEKDFYAKLEIHGVKATPRNATKKQKEYILYELVDTVGFDAQNIPSNLKAKSYKLGADYDWDAINSAFEKNSSSGFAELHKVLSGFDRSQGNTILTKKSASDSSDFTPDYDFSHKKNANSEADKATETAKDETEISPSARPIEIEFLQQKLREDLIEQGDEDEESDEQQDEKNDSIPLHPPLDETPSEQKNGSVAPQENPAAPEYEKVPKKDFKTFPWGNIPVSNENEDSDDFTL